VLNPAPDAVIVLDEIRIGVEMHDERAMDREQRCGVRVAAGCVHGKARLEAMVSQEAGANPEAILKLF
jgi:hypothetical protein